MLENSTWLFGMQVFFKKKWLSLKKGLNYYHHSNFIYQQQFILRLIFTKMPYASIYPVKEIIYQL